MKITKDEYRQKENEFISEKFDANSDARHPIVDGQTIKNFTTAGFAYFTLVSQRTGLHFSYYVKASRDWKAYWVRVRVGPDWLYLGSVIGGVFRRTAKSELTSDHKSFRAFAWFWKHLTDGEFEKAEVDFYHEGTCSSCGRRLTHPESIARGIGPECWKHFTRVLADRDPV